MKSLYQHINCCLPATCYNAYVTHAYKSVYVLMYLLLAIQQLEILTTDHCKVDLMCLCVFLYMYVCIKCNMGYTWHVTLLICVWWQHCCWDLSRC